MGHWESIKLDLMIYRSKINRKEVFQAANITNCIDDARLFEFDAFIHKINND